MANLIPQIAEMLGVKLGEEFKIKGYDDSNTRIYKFTAQGLRVKLVEHPEATEFNALAAFNSLLVGDAEIIKLRWKPKFADRYFGFFEFYGKLRITRYDIWRGTVEEEAQYKCGWIFRTREEAEAALPKVAAELGVEYEL